MLYKIKLDLNDNCYENFNLYLTVLKMKFSNFAMEYQYEFYFTEELSEDQIKEIQTWTDEFTKEKALKELQKGDLMGNETIIFQNTNPRLDTNPDSPAILWINIDTGEIFTCIDLTPDKNIWKGTLGTVIRPIPSADKFDFFNDGSRVAMYLFDRNAYDIGGLYHGSPNKYIEWDNKNKVENYSVYSGSRGKGQIVIKKLPFNSSTESVTIACWMRWKGRSSVMSFGFKSYDLWFVNGYFGFNTSHGDLYGTKCPKNLTTEFVYLIATFKKGQYGNLNLNGEELDLKQVRGSSSSQTTAYMGSSFAIFGWLSNSGYRDFGWIDRLSIFNRELTLDEKLLLYSAEKDYIDSLKDTRYLGPPIKIFGGSIK